MHVLINVLHVSTHVVFSVEPVRGNVVQDVNRHVISIVQRIVPIVVAIIVSTHVLRNVLDVQTYAIHA